MQPIPYTSLDERQRAQVAYLFADHIFGTDANAYLYELTSQGDVTGRTTIDHRPRTTKRALRSAPVTVHTREEVNITDELISHASASMDALAASIAAQLIRSQVEEVKA